MISPRDVSDLALALSVPGIGSAALGHLSRTLSGRSLFDLVFQDLKGLRIKADAIDALRTLIESPDREMPLRTDLEQGLGTDAGLIDLRHVSMPGLDDLTGPPLFLAVNKPFDVRAFVRARVAVVGTRRCSEAGRRLAHELGRQLASRGVLVISGGADGIDSAAHRGAIEGCDDTVVVLGGAPTLERGRDKTRFDWQWRQAMVLGEQLFAQPLLPYMYPRRNRLIAALAQVVVVVEGDLKSGAMNTADWARKLKRSLVAVPGHPSEGGAAGPLKLLSQGATLFRTVDDVLALIDTDPSPVSRSDGAGSRFPDSRSRSSSSPGVDLNSLGAHERKVVEKLRESGDSLDADLLGHETGLSSPQLASVLLGLELKGICRQIAGNRVELI